jgi:hypothetical protein
VLKYPYTTIFGGSKMEKNKLDKTFKHYLGIFTEDKELGKILNKVEVP